MENVVEVQRCWRVEFGTTPPTGITITRIRDNFEVDGTVQDVLKGRCGRKRSLLATIQTKCRSVPRRCWECTVAEGGNFEHVRVKGSLEPKEHNINCISVSFRS